LAFSGIYEVINLTVLDLFNFSLFRFICRFFILEFRIFYSLPLLYVLSVYWLYLWLFRMKFVCNWLDSIFIICIISSWLFLLNVSFSIYLTDPFEDHAAEFYFYLDDNYFCWQWGKNNIIDIICFWCLFDHRCTVSLNCFYSFFLVTCCTATLHFQIQWSFYFDFSFIGKPLSFSFHFLTILVILVCHWSSLWADSFW